MQYHSIKSFVFIFEQDVFAIFLLKILRCFISGSWSASLKFSVCSQGLLDKRVPGMVCAALHESVRQSAQRGRYGFPLANGTLPVF